MIRILDRPIEAVLFDLDGTLADSHPVHNPARFAAFEDMAQLSGDGRYVQIDPELHEQAHLYGSNPRNIIGWVLLQANIISSLDDPRLDQVVQLKHDHYVRAAQRGLDPQPGAIRLVSRLATRLPGKLGIGTTAHKDTEVLPFLKRHRLDLYFHDHQLATAEDVDGHLKPDPLVYHILMKNMLLDNPDRVLIIEDSLHGIEAAKRAGAMVVAVANTVDIARLRSINDEQARPDHIFADLDEVGHLL